MPIKTPKSKIYNFKEPENSIKEDLGFGEKFTGHYCRLLNDDGSFNITRTGISSRNIFKKLITMSWVKLFGYFILLYVIVNFLFACLYFMGGKGTIDNLNDGSPLSDLEQLLYFSFQTFTTVGYGKLNPVSSYANVIAAFNAFVGLMFFALAAGLFFTKFSSPLDHIRFSKNIIIAPYKGRKALMVRMANTIDNHIMNLNARISMSWIAEENNVPHRKFATLPLEIEFINLFPINWTLVHIIDESSPLFNKEKDDLQLLNVEFIIMLNGYDRTYGKVILSNRSYLCKDLIYGAIFEPMYESRNNETILHLEHIDDIKDYSFDVP